MEGIIGKTLTRVLQPLNRFMTWLFGTHWRTTFWAWMVVLPQFINQILELMTSYGIPQKYCNTFSLVCLLFALINAADKNNNTGG